jgi:sugar phosphate isomerase/epimerase
VAQPDPSSARSLGTGHPSLIAGRNHVGMAQTWRDIVSALRTVGYDGAVSIEHEDGLLSIDEGMTKAVAFLRTILFTDAPTDTWWVSG